MFNRFLKALLALIVFGIIAEGIAGTFGGLIATLLALIVVALLIGVVYILLFAKEV